MVRNHLHLGSGGKAAVIALAFLAGLVLAAEVQSGTGPPLGSCFGKPVTAPYAAGTGPAIRGTPGDDVIKGTRGPDTIDGRGGKDRICGGKGDDSLSGGKRDDMLNGQGDRDVVMGDDGDDLHVGGPKDDEILAATGSPDGRDVARGSDGDDRLDTLDGLPNDVAEGGEGTDGCAVDRGEQVRACESRTD